MSRYVLAAAFIAVLWLASFATLLVYAADNWR